MQKASVDELNRNLLLDDCVHKEKVKLKTRSAIDAILINESVIIKDITVHLISQKNIRNESHACRLTQLQSISAQFCNRYIQSVESFHRLIEGFYFETESVLRSVDALMRRACAFFASTATKQRMREVELTINEIHVAANMKGDPLAVFLKRREALRSVNRLAGKGTEFNIDDNEFQESGLLDGFGEITIKSASAEMARVVADVYNQCSTMNERLRKLVAIVSEIYHKHNQIFISLKNSEMVLVSINEGTSVEEADALRTTARHAYFVARTYKESIERLQLNAKDIFSQCCRY